jgi:hypothetical protein
VLKDERPAEQLTELRPRDSIVLKEEMPSEASTELRPSDTTVTREDKPCIPGGNSPILVLNVFMNSTTFVLKLLVPGAQS